MNNSLRIVFAGTPDFAARHLAALLSSQHQIVAVYTKPDRPAGRGKKITTSPVKDLAQQQNIPIYQPENFSAIETQQALTAINADLMVVVAYGLLLPSVILTTPRLGCINVHGSILPRWRGAAPIQRAIWAGDEQTGVTIMQMDEGLDTGDMLQVATLPIEEKETSATLYQRLAELAPSALLACLDDIAAGQAVAQKQDDQFANYAKKLSKEEARIDWCLTAKEIERCIRAFNPWPMSYFTLKTHDQCEHNIKVWAAEIQTDIPLSASNTNAPNTNTPGTILSADKNGISVVTGDGILRLISIQLPGKKAMSTADILNSRRNWFEPGNIL